MSISIQSDKDFFALLQDIDPQQKIIIKFGAKWCQPCQIIQPVFEEEARVFPQHVFVHIDIDRCSKLAETFKVSSIPSFFAMGHHPVNQRIHILKHITGSDAIQFHNFIHDVFQTN